MVRRACLLALGLLVSACTKDAYVVGAVCSALDNCPTGGSNLGGSAGATGAGASGEAGHGGAERGPLTLDFTGSGPERLPQQLFGLAPSHFLLATDATAQSWPARIGVGFEVAAQASIATGEAGPFADPGRVLAFDSAAAFSARSSWAETTAGALALEAVFRAPPAALLLTQQGASAGVQWSLDAESRLVLHLDSGSAELSFASQPLVADAWHHCLALFDASQSSAQMFCNGEAGAAVTIPQGFVVPAPSEPALVGGAGTPRVHLAQLARWQGSAFAAAGSWSDAARERFARLVGSYASGSAEPLPFAAARSSGAYLDMSPSDAPEQRRIYAVGRDWPRIVCRPSLDSARLCGLLVEPASSQPVGTSQLVLGNWQASEVELAPAAAAGPTGDPSLYGLSSTANTKPHSLDLPVTFGAGPAVVSLFARPGPGTRLRVEAVGIASAIFDINAAGVLETTGTRLSAAEDWGGGLVRLSFSFDVQAGPGRLRITMLDDAAQLFVGDVDLHFRSFSTPLPTFGAIQAADHLIYPAGNGNLPNGSRFGSSAEIWLPAAPLVADAAIFNANFAGRFDQQLNLFVSPQDNAPQFWGRQTNAQAWQFSNPVAINDGKLHSVRASVGESGAQLDVDGKTISRPTRGIVLASLDRIEIGTSTSSSGALTGIIRSLRFSAESK